MRVKNQVKHKWENLKLDFLKYIQSQYPKKILQSLILQRNKLLQLSTKAFLSDIKLNNCTNRNSSNCLHKTLVKN